MWRSTRLTVLAAASLAALALARYRESGRLAGFTRQRSFLLIGWVALINVAVVIVKVELASGCRSGDPEQLPLYVSSVWPAVAGALLLVGGAAAVNMAHRPADHAPDSAGANDRDHRLHPRRYAIREWLPNFDELLPAFVGQAGMKQMVEEPSFSGALTDCRPSPCSSSH